MNSYILHITPKTDWTAGLKAGQYASDSLEGQGFIHCSTPEQAIRVADDFYSGQHGLVLLKIDPERLQPELRWEPGTDLPTQLFPHVYGPINLDAVVDVTDFEPDGKGKFHLPGDLQITR